jgi:hypothetical protein
MKLVHYGTSYIDLSLIEEIKNKLFSNKPEGGLWCSPIESKNEWKDFLIGEDWRTETLEKSVIFELKPNSKILKIDSYKDLKKQVSIFEKKIYPEHSYLRGFLDYEKLTLEYDAIFLTANGQYDTRMAFDTNLYGWDCECLLILNKDCLSI